MCPAFENVISQGIDESCFSKLKYVFIYVRLGV
jgi:hypothetical protein